MCLCPSLPHRGLLLEENWRDHDSYVQMPAVPLWPSLLRTDQPAPSDLPPCSAAGRAGVLRLCSAPRSCSSGPCCHRLSLLPDSSHWIMSLQGFKNKAVSLAAASLLLVPARCPEPVWLCSLDLVCAAPGPVSPGSLPAVPSPTKQMKAF